MDKSLPLRDGHQCGLGLLQLDIGSEALEEQITKLSPISRRMSIPVLITDIPLMRKFKQEGNRISDLLGITTSHKAEIMTH